MKNILIKFDTQVYIQKLLLPVGVFLLVFSMLGIINGISDPPLLLLERLVSGGGWIQSVLAGFYGAFLSWKMHDPVQVNYWRRMTWFIFSIVFFVQIIPGIFISEIFLMTGKLHLPVPALILSGPLYRGEFSVMTILFLSTVIISGPAWCSHLCYFGGIDNFIAGKQRKAKIVENKFKIKHSVLLFVVLVTLLLRIFTVPSWIALIAGILFGLTGMAFIFLLSSKNGKMMNCILWCPIGTLVNYFKYISPFRMYIDNNCTACMKCSSYCNYDALNKVEILDHKPGRTCTLCGDCLQSCQSTSIKYKFWHLSPEKSRILFLFITISLHAITLSLARI